MKKKPLLFVLLLLAALPVAGCTRGNGRQTVSGTVALDGKPLDSGSINFRPVGGTAGNGSGGTIKDGEFKIAAAKGLSAGKYSVTVRAVRPTGRTIHDPQMGNVPQLAPVRFREGAALEATVSAGGPNQFEFKLTSAR